MFYVASSKMTAFPERSGREPCKMVSYKTGYMEFQLWIAICKMSQFDYVSNFSQNKRGQCFSRNRSFFSFEASIEVRSRRNLLRKYVFKLLNFEIDLICLFLKNIRNLERTGNFTAPIILWVSRLFCHSNKETGWF